MGKINVPEVTANVAWGDRDYKSLYITATTSLYRIRLNIAGIKPGNPNPRIPSAKRNGMKQSLLDF